MPTLFDQLLSRWRSRPFVPEDHHRLLISGWAQPTESRQRDVAVLSRGVYRTKFFDLGEAPSNQRRALLRNLMLAWSPFDDTDYRVLIKDQCAIGFAWDAARAREGLPDANRQLTLLPECMLRAPLVGDGVRWKQCLEGFELQVWRDGLPRASRWWLHQPSTSDLEQFLRTVPWSDGEAEQRLCTPLTTPDDPPWTASPWARLHSLPELASNLSRLERVVAGSVVMVLSALTGAQASVWFGAEQERRALGRQLESAQMAAAPVLSAKERASALSREAQSLSDQFAGVQPLQVLAHLADVLPAKGVVLKELELAGTKLRLGLELAADVQRSELIRDIQAGRWLTGVTEVREAPGRNWVTFEMQISGGTPPPRVAPAASGPGGAT